MRLLHNHPAVISFLTDVRPVNEIEQKEWYLRISSSRKSYRFVAREKLSSSIVGVFRIDELDHLNQSAQIGLDVHPDFQNRGFGTEIYKIFFNTLFNNWNLNRLYLETLASNTRARKLYAKLGMKEEGQAREAIFRDGKYNDLILYSLLRSEFVNDHE